jgi:hypothetical protein
MSSRCYHRVATLPHRHGRRRGVSGHALPRPVPPPCPLCLGERIGLDRVAVEVTVGEWWPVNGKGYRGQPELTTGTRLSADAESCACGHRLGWAEPGRKEEQRTGKRREECACGWPMRSSWAEQGEERGSGHEVNFVLFSFFLKYQIVSVFCLFHCDLFRAPKIINFFV